MVAHLQRRLTHAARTRADILEVATELAARGGLESLSLGRLAEAMAMSKAGVYAHFGSKEALELAIVEAAFETFVKEVAMPASMAPVGLPRLEALFDGYFRYVVNRAEKGGCFFTAASMEFDDRTGPVRDKIAELTAARDGLIEAAIVEAKAKRQVKGVPKELAISVLALATGTAVIFQMKRDPSLFDATRKAMKRLLGVEMSASKQQ